MKKIMEINLECDSHVAVSVYQPNGGRYVCDVCIETADTEYVLRNVHCDVAESLRDALNCVIEEFEAGDSDGTGNEI